MPAPRERARARSTLYRLFAIGFGHPAPDLHGRLADGTFGQALASAVQSVSGRSLSLPPPGGNAQTFEADFIGLFAAGVKGKPTCPMCMGDYDHLLEGRTRPSFMMEFLQVYRWFGVKPKTEGEDQELPDHLTCQLEFMAYLNHLEAEAYEKGRDATGYRRAQRDFLGRFLARFAPVFVSRLEVAADNADADPYFVALAAELTDFVTGHSHELASEIGAFVAPDEPAPADGTAAGVSEEMNLWG